MPETAAQEDYVPSWKLYVDGSSNENDFGAGLILKILDGFRAHCALQFAFIATKNEAGIEEIKETFKLCKAAYQQKVSQHYSSKVKDRKFMPRYMMLQWVFLNTKDSALEVVSPSWEGPYVITEALQPETYKLARYDCYLNSVPVPRY
uniref:Uncharacterized protein n=1 Tax=Cannabis sativa TaxID=3483 RepID=A0A803PHP3_CANSA